MDKLNRIVYYFLLLVYVLAVMDITSYKTEQGIGHVVLCFIPLSGLAVMHWLRHYKGPVYYIAAALYLLLAGPGIIAQLKLLAIGTHKPFITDVVLYSIPVLHIAFNLCRLFSYAGLWIAATGLLLVLSGILFGTIAVKDPVTYPYPDLEQAWEKYMANRQWQLLILYAGIFMMCLGLALFGRQKSLNATHKKSLSL